MADDNYVENVVANQREHKIQKLAGELLPFTLDKAHWNCEEKIATAFGVAELFVNECIARTDKLRRT